MKKCLSIMLALCMVLSLLPFAALTVSAADVGDLTYQINNNTVTYYYNAVLWAVENNITSGTGAGAFSPDVTCSRGQIVTFLYRAMK